MSGFLDKALEAARAAAEIQRKYYRRNVETRIKADRTPVTVADVECEEAIHAIIGGAFPDHAFLGEETGRHEGSGDYLWLVDPIDGTKSFVRQYPFFSTQIALMRGDELVLGVSSAALFDELAWAEQGEGAWLNGERIQVSEVSELGNATLSTGNIRGLAASAGWQRFGNLVSAVDRIRGYGDFYHYHLLAAGKVDVVVESEVNILDIAALSVIVREAGGRFTDISGAAPGLETTTVLASNGLLHDATAQYL